MCKILSRVFQQFFNDFSTKKNSLVRQVFTGFFFATDKPSAPVIENKEVHWVSGCHVNLKWTPPQDNGCPLTMYTIYYSELQSSSKNESWYQINVTADTTSRDLPSLKCNTGYMFKLSAWNELGESDTSNEWPMKTGIKQPLNGNSIVRTVSIALPVACGTLIFITVAIICFRKRNGKTRKRHEQKKRR